MLFCFEWLGLCYFTGCDFCQVFDEIKDLEHVRNAKNKQTIEWKFLGRRVCRPTWTSLHGIGDLAGKKKLKVWN